MNTSVDKRQRIMDAASRLFVRDGLQCSMAAIAVEARVATGSLYNYFASKEILIREIYAEMARVMHQTMTSTPATDLSHNGRIRQYLGCYIDFIWEDPERAALFDYLNNNPVLTIEQTSDLFRDFLLYTDNIILSAQKDHIVRSGSPRLLASFVRGAIRHTLKRRRLEVKVLKTEERKLIIDMCLSALILT